MPDGRAEAQGCAVGLECGCGSGEAPCAALAALGALSAQERERRSVALRAIEQRVRASGPHVARAYPERARQFMPFAALKGYQELTREREG